MGFFRGACQVELRNSTRNYLRRLTFILVFWIFRSTFTVSAAAEFTFEQYEVVLGSAERQTVLTGFLLGGAVAGPRRGTNRREWQPPLVHVRIRRQPIGCRGSTQRYVPPCCSLM